MSETKEEWCPEREANELDEKRREIQAITGTLSNRGSYTTRHGNKVFICYDCAMPFLLREMKTITDPFKEGRKIVRPICKTCDAIRLAEEVGV